MRTQDRLRALREHLRAAVGERAYRIRTDGTVEIYSGGWCPVGRWTEIEPEIRQQKDVKKWLTKAASVI